MWHIALSVASSACHRRKAARCQSPHIATSSSSSCDSHRFTVVSRGKHVLIHTFSRPPASVPNNFCLSCHTDLPRGHGASPGGRHRSRPGAHLSDVPAARPARRRDAGAVRARRPPAAGSGRNAAHLFRQRGNCAMDWMRCGPNHTVTNLLASPGVDGLRSPPTTVCPIASVRRAATS